MQFYFINFGTFRYRFQMWIQFCCFYRKQRWIGTSSCHLHDAFTVVTVGCLVQLPEMNETLFVSFRILLHFCFILSKFSFFVSFSQKNCFILLHSCFILLPSCFILFHSSFIPHSACFILLQSCFILFHSLPARFSSHSICFILLGQYFNGLNFSK